MVGEANVDAAVKPVKPLGFGSVSLATAAKLEFAPTKLLVARPLATMQAPWNKARRDAEEGATSALPNEKQQLAATKTTKDVPRIVQ